MHTKIIDPTKPIDSKHEPELLKAAVRLCEPFLDKGELGVKVKSRWHHITLTNPLQIHESAKDAGKFRVEVLEPKPCAAGSYGKIFKSLGRLAPEKRCVFKAKPEKPDARICKVIPINDDTSEENILDEYKFTKLNPYLHCKPVELDDNNGYLTMRYVGTENLHEYRKKLKNNPAMISIEKRMELTLNVLKAIKEQVLDLGILHKDIKPENMRIDTNTWQIFIIDYAFACEKEDAVNARDFSGTLVYLPPEVLFTKDEDRAARSEITEMFAVGLILSEIWGNRSIAVALKKCDQRVDDMRNFHKKQVWFDLFKGIDLAPEYMTRVREFLNHVTAPNPAKRYNMQQALEEWEQILNDYKVSLTEDEPKDEMRVSL